MKILLDESVPRKLKYDFDVKHQVFTVRDKGWLGQKNGILLKLMVDDNFEIFVTVDRNLSYQQNIAKLPVIIFVLCAFNNRRDTLSKLIPAIFDRIAKGDLKNVNEIW
ncbi:MAG TPA: DUF5615 family PIN-like protein [Hanamia sp.]|jgi:predicted nuclease of predicted toxin-antitoxin system|nr:DUF5615 family PIN-like protein [Hanamia sp.]